MVPCYKAISVGPEHVEKSCAGRRAEPLGTSAQIELAESAGEPWHISPEGSVSRSFVEAVFAANGLAMPQIKVASYSVPLQYSLCATGKFITATSSLTLHFNGKRQGSRRYPSTFRFGRGPSRSSR
jgi:hypothetical protein